MQEIIKIASAAAMAGNKVLHITTEDKSFTGKAIELYGQVGCNHAKYPGTRTHENLYVLNISDVMGNVAWVKEEGFNLLVMDNQHVEDSWGIAQMLKDINCNVPILLQSIDMIW